MPPPPLKRKPGRPKGSLNKKQRCHESDQEAIPKRLCRPPGTGYLQRARAAGTAPPEEPKRPVGRPRIHFSPEPTAIHLGRIHVPGQPPPLRLGNPVSEANTLRMSGGRLVPGNIATLHTGPLLNSGKSVPTGSGTEHLPPEPDDSNIVFSDNDETEETGLVNDGVGDDNDSDSDGEDEPDPGVSGGDNSEIPQSLTSQKKCSGGPAHKLPKWLMNMFQKHVKASSVLSDGLPPLYKEGKTF
ncbi:hypothetical protein K438DRAFT_1771792 [Mycena galopus ATCC 62051]|nr:hypothetical protein K438DRAFT_1771792 [Mycena galopus ATCC 62051]